MPGLSNSGCVLGLNSWPVQAMQVQQGGVTEPSPEDVEVWVSDFHRLEFHPDWPSSLANLKLKDPVVYCEVILKHVCTAAIDHLTASSTFPRVDGKVLWHLFDVCALQRSSFCNGMAYSQCVGASVLLQRTGVAGALKVAQAADPSSNFASVDFKNLVCSSWRIDKNCIWSVVWNIFYFLIILGC